MKKKLMDFLTRWQAASKVMKSKHFIVAVSDGERYEVAHNDVPVETVRKVVGYLTIKVQIDYENSIEK